jgi:hypothetical protein
VAHRATSRGRAPRRAGNFQFRELFTNKVCKPTANQNRRERLLNAQAQPCPTEQTGGSDLRPVEVSNIEQLHSDREYNVGPGAGGGVGKVHRGLVRMYLGDRGGDGWKLRPLRGRV